jgi:hypothetical protein
MFLYFTSPPIVMSGDCGDAVPTARTTAKNPTGEDQARMPVLQEEEKEI